MQYSFTDQALLEVVVAELVALGVSEIWIFGSQATGNVKQGSDIDLLVIAPCDLRERLATRPEWIGYDIFVNISGETKIVNPWNSKEGDLKSWRWKKLTDCTAEYIGNGPSWDGNPNAMSGGPCPARLLYPISIP